jgi:LCP family protein required for cell wall assembly
MVSIPRDIWIPEIRAKINSAYYWGKTGSPYFDNKSDGGGIGLAKKMVEEVTGQPVQYGVVVDFSSFKDIVDALGGVQVDVENTFTDKLYPIEGKENDICGGDPTFACRYETVTFSPGPQTMDGETALKFVRSRHAEGTEGTDIAREARQQKVIDAIKDKVVEPSTFLSPKVDLAMLGIAKKYIETDIDLPTAGTLLRFAAAGSKNIGQFLIPEDLLVNPPASNAYDNLYVFIPKAGNGKWEAIHSWFQEILGN